MTSRTVIVECPDSAALVDFLDVGTVSLTLEKRKGRRVIVVLVKLDDGSGYGWSEYEHVIPAPIRKVRK